MIPPDAATRAAAAHVLNSRSARDLARLVISSAREGRLLAPDDVALVLRRMGVAAHLAELCANAIVLRAAASLLLESIERERARAASVTPIATLVIGRMRRMR